MSNKLFNDYRFQYIVPKELLCMPVVTDKLEVVATSTELCKGIAPVITIAFENINVLDIMNITNWELVKRDCEVIAEIHFKKSSNIQKMNVVELAANHYGKAQNPHYNFPKY